jgi:hypothetical protein
MESREDLKAFLDGELTPSQEEAVRVAAESDPEVQGALQELRAVGAAISDAKREYEVQGLEQTLTALAAGNRLSLPSESRKRSWIGYYVGFGAAAALALCFAVPAFLNSKKDSTLVADKSAALSAPMSIGKSFNQKQSFRPMFPTRPMPSAKGRDRFAAPPPARIIPLSEQLRIAQQQVAQLKKDNELLRAKSGADFSPRAGANGKPLPALPLTPGEIMPTLGDAAGDANQSFGMKMAHGLPPEKVAQFEAQVRKQLVEEGAKLELGAGPPELRTLTATIATPKATTLVEHIRKLLKASGTVTVEDLPTVINSDPTGTASSRVIDLKLEREKLLVQFLPEAPEVKEIDDQIKTLEAQIKPKKVPARSRLRITIGS